MAANAALRVQLAEVTAERDQLLTSANTPEARLEMARAERERLVQQLKSAEAEVSQLKEDLGFFEALLPATGDTSG
ncbi:DNA-binding protein, partial [Variovorax sp. 2RAF20]